MKNTTLPTPTELDRHYYYRPLKFDGGNTYKCAGFGAEGIARRNFYIPHFDKCEDGNYLPGTVVLRGYHGDRLTKDYATREALK